jgi:hypothetical protein
MSEALLNRLVSSDAVASSEEQWPSIAYLFNPDEKASCTVSIIGPRWLLTSYRCIEKT